ncbi:hypothetical protein Aduo_017129 [Ancylostoma duodenale]
MSALLHMPFFTLLWLCFVASHVEAAKPPLDPLELMKLPRTNNICPQLTTARMSDQARNLIVDIHNRRRTVLAQGLVRNGRNNYNMPQGSNIMTMRYNCDLEKDAQMYADLCTSAGSPEATRPLWGENFSIIQDTLDPILAAGDAWWGQIYGNGINQKMLFNKFFAEKLNSPTAFTQMAWATSYEIGCGVGDCAPTTNVVCRYTAKGNNIGEYVYEPGQPCTACDYGCTPEGVLCYPPP